MNDTTNHKIVKCMKSLVDAVNQAGGNPELSYIFQMTVFDFIMKTAGPNNIRFAYHGETQDIVLKTTVPNQSRKD